MPRRGWRRSAWRRQRGRGSRGRGGRGRRRPGRAGRWPGGRRWRWRRSETRGSRCHHRAGRNHVRRARRNHVRRDHLDRPRRNHVWRDHLGRVRRDHLRWRRPRRTGHPGRRLARVVALLVRYTDGQTEVEPEQRKRYVATVADGLRRHGDVGTHRDVVPLPAGGQAGAVAEQGDTADGEHRGGTQVQQAGQDRLPGLAGSRGVRGASAPRGGIPGGRGSRGGLAGRVPGAVQQGEGGKGEQPHPDRGECGNGGDLDRGYTGSGPGLVRSGVLHRVCTVAPSPGVSSHRAPSHGAPICWTSAVIGSGWTASGPEYG